MELKQLIDQNWYYILKNLHFAGCSFTSSWHVHSCFVADWYFYDLIRRSINRCRCWRLSNGRNPGMNEWMNILQWTARRALVNAVCRRNQTDISAISLSVMCFYPLLPLNSTFAAQSAPFGSPNSVSIDFRGEESLKELPRLRGDWIVRGWNQSAMSVRK